MTGARVTLSPRRAATVAAIPSVTTAISLLWLRNGWAAILCYHATIVTVCVLTGRPRREQILSGRWTGTAIACCGLTALVGIVLYVFLPGVVNRPLGAQLESCGIAGAAWVLFAPYFALVNPILEEAFWRGCLPASDKVFALQDFLFAAYHLFVLALFVTPICVATAALGLVLVSALWRRVARESGGLLPVFASHMAADIGIIAAVALRR